MVPGGASSSSSWGFRSSEISTLAEGSKAGFCKAIICAIRKEMVSEEKMKTVEKEIWKDVQECQEDETADRGKRIVMNDGWMVVQVKPLT